MSVFTRLHRKLRIPKNFHRAHTEPKAPLSVTQRTVALETLKSAEVIAGPTKDEILKAIAQRFVKLAGPLPARVPLRGKRGAVVRSPIFAVILADPAASPQVLADRAKCMPKTIVTYRSQLRREGRI